MARIHRRMILKKDLHDPDNHDGVITQFSSVQFSCLVVSNSLWPHELQHTRPPCPSPTPGVHLNSRPSSQWCHPAISSSVVPFSSCPQSIPASGSFPMSQLFTWSGQSIGVSASASVLPMNYLRLFNFTRKSNIDEFKIYWSIWWFSWDLCQCDLWIW